MRVPFWISVGLLFCAAIVLGGELNVARAEGDWEITPQSEESLERGLKWLAANQGPDGNWESNDLGLVGMGALAFLSAGHTPGHGRYGANVDKALSYILRNAKPSGLLNISDQQRDMYNHGLATFVLGQAHGITNDPRFNNVLDKALKLTVQSQCADGGWDYRSTPSDPNRGHDLSLAVMQAKSLRSAVDSGLEVPPEVIQKAIRSVREHYSVHGKSEAEAKKEPGQFTYSRGGGHSTPAMAAAGVVCLQEFGQYDDWRIAKCMEVIRRDIKQQLGDPKKQGAAKGSGHMVFDAYTLYYVGQALYQVGGKDWEECYPLLRDSLVASQSTGKNANQPQDGWWQSGRHVDGKPGMLYGTSVACFILAIPNRYLPILQEGKIDSLKGKFQQKD